MLAETRERFDLLILSRNQIQNLAVRNTDGKVDHRPCEAILKCNDFRRQFTAEDSLCSFLNKLRLSEVCKTPVIVEVFVLEANF